MINTPTKKNSTFPLQNVSNAEKMSDEYGLKVAQAIEQEWFRVDKGIGRYEQNRENYHRLRLYARGEQSVRKYKDEFAINGDLSYLNLDWKPVPIVPKFVDIVVNGMQDRLFTVKAVAQDPVATERRTRFVEQIEEDMLTQGYINQVKQQFGEDISNTDIEKLPKSTEELELYMQLEYKQGIEIAIEQAIDNVLMRNRYEDTKRRVDYDITVLGIGAAKHTFNNTDGIKVEYVDPANLIYSYTEDPNFEDVYYFGEVKRVKLNELKKKYPWLTDDQLQETKKGNGGWADYQSSRFDWEDAQDENTVEVLYFNWKTWENDIHKVKETAYGGLKALEKNEDFNPPKDKRSHFEKVSQTREIVMQGALILGTEIMLDWSKAKNMVRPDSNANKVMMDYVVVAPHMYKGRIKSLVDRMITYADMIQITHLKLQQAVQKLTPSGIYVDADGLMEIDLGNGTSYNPQEALNMYFQTGSIIGRSLTVEGDPNPGKIPIQELPGGGGQQIQLLIASYQQNLQMIRDITGLNEARDGSDPDPYALVGVQKLAAANSNTATRHIMQSSLSVYARLAECITTRFKDVLAFHPQKEAFINSIGKFSVGSLRELDKLHIHDFGIFIEIEPDEEEKAVLAQHINTALTGGMISIDDVIDIEGIKNINLAKRMLKYRRQRKAEEDAKLQQANMQAQSQAQAQANAVMEGQKQKTKQLEGQMDMQLENTKAELEMKKLEADKKAKMELMDHEFTINKQIMELQAQQQAQMAREASAAKLTGEKLKMDGKAKEVKKPWESRGNDVIGSIDTNNFKPK